jgi:hypothetical protein
LKCIKCAENNVSPLLRATGAANVLNGDGACYFAAAHCSEFFCLSMIYIVRLLKLGELLSANFASLHVASCSANIIAFWNFEELASNQQM